MGSKWLEYLPELSISLERPKKPKTKQKTIQGGGEKLASRSKSVVLETVMDEKYARHSK